MYLKFFFQKGVKFETLSAPKAKDYFKKFTKKWNSKKLPKVCIAKTEINICSGESKAFCFEGWI